jgi:hypothetical protein
MHLPEAQRIEGRYCVEYLPEISSANGWLAWAMYPG